MKKNACVKYISMLFSVTLCLLLAGCTGLTADKASRDSNSQVVELDLRNGTDLRKSDVLSLVDGVAYETALSDELYVLLPETQHQIELSNGAWFHIDSIAYCLADSIRISAVYRDVFSLGAGDSVQVDASCSGSAIDDATKREVLTLVGETFFLYQTGNSAISTEPFLQVSSTNTFSALYFSPRIVRIEGRIADVNNTEVCSVTLEYPCVNLLGCLDGTYKVLEVYPEDG